MKLVELVRREFVHLNLAYSSKTAAPTIGAARTTAETATKMSKALKMHLNTNNIVLTTPKQMGKQKDSTECKSRLLDIY